MSQFALPDADGDLGLVYYCGFCRRHKKELVECELIFNKDVHWDVRCPQCEMLWAIPYPEVKNIGDQIRPRS